jgi:hypothetical protein
MRSQRAVAYDGRMRLVRVALVIALAACSSKSAPATVDASIDAPAGPACTGATYDPCTDNTQCASAQCHMYNGAALQVCTVACGATATCPNDAAGLAVGCNMMGNCKPSVANNCHR